VESFEVTRLVLLFVQSEICTESALKPNLLQSFARERAACLVVCILLAFLFAEIIKTWELILPAAVVDDDDAPTKHTLAGWLAAAAAAGGAHSLLNE
jgi:hypothetical protein